MKNRKYHNFLKPPNIGGFCFLWKIKILKYGFIFQLLFSKCFQKIKIISVTQTTPPELMKSQHRQLVNSLLKLAVRYARLRVDWLMSDAEDRKEMDPERTAAHNAFISSCDILSRNMLNSGENASWRNQIGSDRKAIGDFACMLHAVMDLMAR